MKFYIGIHQVSDAKHFDRFFLSVNRLKDRKKIIANEWIMDSGAFSQLVGIGEHMAVDDYVQYIEKFKNFGNLVAAVSQDYMCEPFVLKKTGMSVKEHQKLTIKRYLLLVKKTNQYIMPVIQGYKENEYIEHINQYGEVLEKGAYVGVGSVCKRNSEPAKIKEILMGIKDKRPDLKLHGFGLKYQAVFDREIRNLLYSSDSMAWSFAARYEGRNANSWMEAKNYYDRIQELAAAN